MSKYFRQIQNTDKNKTDNLVTCVYGIIPFKIIFKKFKALNKNLENIKLHLINYKVSGIL